MHRGLLVTIAVICAAVASGVDTHTGHADATGTGRFEFGYTVSSYGSYGLPDGPLVTSLAVGTGMVTVFAADPVAAGTAWLRECGTAASPDDPRVELTPGSISTLRVLRSTPTCLYTDVPARLSALATGTVSSQPADGSQFVPLDTPQQLLSAEHSFGSTAESISIPRPSVVPADATAAVVSLHASSSAPGYLALQACSPSLDFPDLQLPAVSLPDVVVLVRIGPTDDLCIKGLTGPTLLEVRLLGWMSRVGPDPDSLPPMYTLAPGFSPEPGLVAFNPRRVLDTRSGIGCIVEGGGCRRPTRPFVAGFGPMSFEFRVGARPSTTAVSMNVTVANSSYPGYVTVWPCEGERPTTSVLNYRGGNATRANLVVAPLSSDGTVCLYSSVNASFIVDVTATYEFGGGLRAEALEPQRLLDTRSSLGVVGRSKLPAGSTLTLQVAGRGGVPADARAATINYTAVDADADGYITAWPCDQTRPESSILNFSTGPGGSTTAFVARATVPNLATVALSAAGTMCVYTSAAIHLLGDVAAWYGDDGSTGLVDLPPGRLLDTRNGIGGPVGALAGGGVITLQVTGREGVRPDAEAVVMNLTLTGTAAAGYATVWPCDTARPEVSNLNFGPGDTVANLTTVKLSAAGTVCIFADQAAHVIADVAGFLTPEPAFGVVPQLV